MVDVAAASVGCFLVFRVLPAIVRPKEAATRMGCMNNLKQIGLALNTYHDIFGCFPPQSITDLNGKPVHSWRRLILPYLDSHPPGIVWPIDVSEPWDSPKNLAAAKRFLPPCYYCPTERYFAPANRQPPSSGVTNYVMIVGAETVAPPKEGLSLEEITDGTAYTVIVAEIANSDILWTEPRDLNFDEMSFRINDKSKPSISSHHYHGACAVFADGHCEFFEDTLDPEALKAMLTRAGNERASLDGQQKPSD